MAAYIVTLLLLTAHVIAYPDYWTRRDISDEPCRIVEPWTLEWICEPGTDLYGDPQINPDKNLPAIPKLGDRNCIRIRLKCSQTIVLLQELNCCHSRLQPAVLDYALTDAAWELQEQLETFILRSCQTLPNGTTVHGKITVARKTAEKSESCAVFDLVSLTRNYSKKTVVSSGYQNVGISVKGIGIVSGKSRKSQDRSAKVDNSGGRYIWTFVWAGIVVIGVGLIVLYNCIVNVLQDGKYYTLKLLGFLHINRAPPTAAMTALAISSVLLLSATLVHTYPDYWHRAKDQDLPCEFDTNETLARACNPGTNVVGTPDNYAGRCTMIRVRCSATTVRIEELNCCQTGSGRPAWERDFGNTSWSLGLERRMFMLGSCQGFPNGILAAAQNLTKKCAVRRKLHGQNGEVESVTFWALVVVGFLGISIVVGLLVMNNSIEDE